MNPQPMEALAKATEVRRARAALKADIRLGKVTAVEVMEDESPGEWLEGMAVLDVLSAHPGWGKRTALKAMSRAEVADGTTVGWLTRLDRYRLVDALEGRL